MQSDRLNTRVKYIVLCALASVSMATIGGDRTGISVYGTSTDQGYRRQIYGGGNGVYRYYSSPTQDSCNQPDGGFYSRCFQNGNNQGYYQQPPAYNSPPPYGGYQPPYDRGYSEGYHDGYHQGQHHPSKPQHGTRFSNRRYKNQTRIVP